MDAEALAFLLPFSPGGCGGDALSLSLLGTSSETNPRPTSAVCRPWLLSRPQLGLALTTTTAVIGHLLAFGAVTTDDVFRVWF